VNDVLDGQVALDLECLDRVYLNGWVNNLQVGGQVVSFLTAHLGYPIPSPAIFDKIGTAFRRAVTRFAEQDHIPVVRFTKADRKIETMRPYLAAQTKTGRSGVAAIGVAQEYASVFTGTEREGSTGAPWFAFHKADRRVTCYYFYIWDDDFGPGFIKICAYFPYPAKIWINGHEWAKRQATHAEIGFTELSNGFAATDDPAGLQAICDRLGPATIEAFAERWFAVLPLPLTPHDQAGGYWWEISMRQVEVSRTIVARSSSPASDGTPRSSVSAQARMPAIGVRSWWAASARNWRVRSSEAVASPRAASSVTSVVSRVLDRKRCSVMSRAIELAATT